MWSGPTRHLPDWASDVIRRAVDAYLLSPSSNDLDLLRTAASFRALPVYGDLGGALLLGEDGEVYIDGGGDDGVERQDDDGWRVLAWAAAAQQVPELRALLPNRPAGYPLCPACNGAGRIQATPSINVWCGRCWGLGWEGGPPCRTPSSPNSTRR